MKNTVRSKCMGHSAKCEFNQFLMLGAAMILNTMPRALCSMPRAASGTLSLSFPFPGAFPEIAVTVIGMTDALLAVVMQEFDATFQHDRAAGDIKSGFSSRLLHFH